VDNDIQDPWAVPPQTQDRPVVEPPKSAQSPDRQSAADMIKSKPKRGLLKFIAIPAALGLAAWMFWPQAHKNPGQAKIDASASVDANGGASILQAAQQAQSDSDRKDRDAEKAAAAKNGQPSTSGSPTVGRNPNAAAMAAMGDANQDSTTGNGNGHATAAGAAQKQNQAAADARDEKLAEISASEIQSNGVQVLPASDKDGSAAGGSGAAGAKETPQQMGDRLAKELLTQQQNESGEMDKALSLAGTLGSGGSAQQEAIVSPGGIGAASQQDKWVKSQTSSEGQVEREQAKPAGDVIQEGTPIRTALITALNTDAPGKITALVTSDVYDSATGNELLIPRGSRVVGAYDHNVQNGQDRVLVALTRLILPNGEWIDLANATGAEMDGAGGLAGDVNNHFFKMFGSALVVGAATLLLDKSQQNVTVSQGLGTTQLGGSIFAQTLNEVISNLLSKNKDIPPTITRDAATEFIFVVQRDMVLTPYHRS
jgi:type IV secretory pathway VirB10-like protein